jgi:hypothetical protein
MTMQFRALAEQAMADGAITPEEVMFLRREGWSDGEIDPAEAEALFVLNDHLNDPPVEWVDCFVEALVEFCIDGGVPRGFLSEAQGEWLVGRIDHDGQVNSLAELELLAKLLERADNVPEALKAYALHQIEQTVLTGKGPTRDGSRPINGRLGGACITDTECRLLRRMLFARAGNRSTLISQREAEVLFRIKDATLGAPNGADWPRLFVQGVGNYLMGLNGTGLHGNQSFSPARAVENFMDDATPRIGRFINRLLKSDVESAAVRVLGFGRKGVTPEYAAQIAAAKAVTPTEDAWLRKLLESDGTFDELEQALLKFIGEEENR